MAKKINLSGAKEFLFNHGEKVALGTCAFLALVLGALGLLRALSATKADGSDKTWAAELKGRTKLISDAIANAKEPVFSKQIEDRMSPAGYVWDPVESRYVMSPYGLTSEDSSNKRMNPSALPIKSGAKNFQLDYIRGLALVHEYDNSVVKGLGFANAPDVANPQPQPKGPKGKKFDEQMPVLPAFLHKGRPVRMVVVRAVFPMKKQVEEFQKALKMTSQKEMFDNRDDLPRVIGINVVRLEIVNGKEVSVTLLGLDETSKFVTAESSKAFKALDHLLRDAIYDEDLPELLKEYIYAGLGTPMPKLANVHYPKVTIDGFDIDYAIDPDENKPKMRAMQPMKMAGGGREFPGRPTPKRQPMQMNPDPVMAAAGAERQVEDIRLRDLRKANPALADRLFFAESSKKPEYNIYHALGLPLPKEDPNQAPGPRQAPGAGMQNPNDPDRYFHAWDFSRPEVVDKGPDKVPPVGPAKKGLKGPMPLPAGVDPVFFPPWERDALVQFIDPGVEAGKTYSYAIQVRLANPNFGKPVDLVAFGRLTAEKELVSTWVVTPNPITIPQEFYFYAVDQQLMDDWAKKAERKKAENFKKDETSFQIHQWTETAPNPLNNQGEVVIGDWAIAKHVAVRRGESIGEQVPVLVPIWQKVKEGPGGFPGAFEIPKLMKHMLPKNNTAKKDGSKFEMRNGLSMDMKSDAERPFLVDFTGGKRLRGATTFIEEETAVEALIMSPDGKLTVLNSRVDSAAPDRQQRVQYARDRVMEIMQQQSGTNNPTNPIGPRVPGKKGP
jgi:hypothetical protein